MSELTWKNAIIKVLEEEKKTLHYTEIAELIADRNYRQKNETDNTSNYRKIL